MFETHLALSTAHLPEIPDFGDLHAVRHEAGFVVFYTEDREDVPEWLHPVLDKARERECSLVLFHEDAPVMKGLAA